MIKPMPGFLVLSYDKEKETTTQSGLILTSTSNVQTPCGKVLAMGQAIHTEHGILPVPQLLHKTVFFHKEDLLEIRDQQKTYFLLAWHQVLAVKESHA